jgi:hypothetical protein
MDLRNGMLTGERLWRCGSRGRRAARRRTGQPDDRRSGGDSENERTRGYQKDRPAPCDAARYRATRAGKPAFDAVLGPTLRQRMVMRDGRCDVFDIFRGKLQKRFVGVDKFDTGRFVILDGGFVVFW